ncbi:MAG: SRPBCC family protein [Pseudonocardiaceae bacterium]
MSEFTLSGRADAPVEEVWKLLFDPTRFPEWWTGVQAVRNDDSDGYTMWLQEYPDFPIPQRLRGDRAEGRVTISCQVSGIDFVWQLAEDGPGTRIHVHVALPESEAHKLDEEREIITTSLARLATLAKATATG